ncbi:MAG TPA: hypothetical protein VGW38_19670, partial [Chloroflexota bacterium]|nr:hypothetical protein [Chloroflexota bacterium]
MVALIEPEAGKDHRRMSVTLRPPEASLQVPIPMTTGRRMIVASGARLVGEITANGAKNAATKMMASALLTREPVVLDNVPNIEAIRTQAELLRSLGAQVEYSPANRQMTIVAEKLRSATLPAELAAKERSSFLLVGPLLARLGSVDAPKPGGCRLGERPVNVDIRGFTAMG